MAPERLPSGWDYKPLGQFTASLESGSRPRGGVSRYTSGVPSISAEQIAEDGKFRWDAIKYVPDSFYEAATKGRIAPNDILVVKDGATTGKCAFVGPDFPFSRAMVNEHTFILRTEPTLLPKFAYYYLKSPYCADFFSHSRARGVIGGLTTDFIVDLSIPVPPLEEQRRIVARIDQLTSRLRRAAELHREATEDGDRLRQVNVESVFAQIKNAERVPLQEVLAGKPRNGWSPPADSHAAAGVPVLTLSAVTGFRYDGSKIKWTAAQTRPDAHYWLRPGELLITRSNTPELVGHAAIYDGNPERCICPDLIMKMSVEPTKAHVRFIHYWLQTTEARCFITSRARGTSGSMKKIAQGDVQAIPVPRIPLPDQAAILVRLDSFRREAERLTAEQGTIQTQLERFPPALLAKAFRGEL